MQAHVPAAGGVELLGQEAHLGTLAEGKVAGSVILDGNPLPTSAKIRQVEVVLRTARSSGSNSAGIGV